MNHYPEATFLQLLSDKKIIIIKKYILFCLPGASWVPHLLIASTARPIGVPAPDIFPLQQACVCPAKPLALVWSGSQVLISLSSEEKHMLSHWISAQQAVQIQKRVSTNELNSLSKSKFSNK